MQANIAAKGNGAEHRPKKYLTYMYTVFVFYCVIIVFIKVASKVYKYFRSLFLNFWLALKLDRAWEHTVHCLGHVKNRFID